MGTKVILNVYDLSPINDTLYAIGFGLHHSGVEILGSEYSFAGGGGIFESSPKEAPGAKFRESIDMGTFEGGASEVRMAIADLRDDFGPNSYNLVLRNCNHFANALCWSLLNKTIPAYVNRLADFGRCCSCCLPRKMLDSAPVGPNDGSGGDEGGGGSGFQVMSGWRAGGGDGSGTKTNAFSGSGSKLGSSNESEMVGLSGRLLGVMGSAGRSSESREDLKDRREKARMAAMARLERSKNEDTGGLKSS